MFTNLNNPRIPCKEMYFRQQNYSICNTSTAKMNSTFQVLPQYVMLKHILTKQSADY